MVPIKCSGLTNWMTSWITFAQLWNGRWLQTLNQVCESHPSPGDFGKDAIIKSQEIGYVNFWNTTPNLTLCGLRHLLFIRYTILITATPLKPARLPNKACNWLVTCRIGKMRRSIYYLWGGTLLRVQATIMRASRF